MHLFLWEKGWSLLISHKHVSILCVKFWAGFIVYCIACFCKCAGVYSTACGHFQLRHCLSTFVLWYLVHGSTRHILHLFALRVNCLWQSPRIVTRHVQSCACIRSESQCWSAFVWYCFFSSVLGSLIAFTQAAGVHLMQQSRKRPCKMGNYERSLHNFIRKYALVLRGTMHSHFSNCWITLKFVAWNLAGQWANKRHADVSMRL